jgi:hypothetical protein
MPSSLRHHSARGWLDLRKCMARALRYDMAELSKFVKQIVIGTAIVGFIHYKSITRLHHRRMHMHIPD